MVKQGALLVVGKKGSGKTNLVREFLNEQERVLNIDPMGEFGGTIIEDPHSLVAWLNRNRVLPRWRVSYRDRGLTPVPTGVVFKALQSLRNCWLGLDEASLWRLTPEAEWFFAFGRHNGISIAATVQRAHQIGPVMRSQADVIVSFRQTEPRDLDWVAEVAGDEKRSEVSELPDFEWTYLVVEHEEIRATLDAISTDEGGDTDARMDSAAVVDGAAGDRGAHLVAAAPDGEGPEGLGAGSEGPRHPGVADRPGSASGAGEARGGESADAGRQDRQADGDSHRGGGRRKARKVV